MKHVIYLSITVLSLTLGLSHKLSRLYPQHATIVQGRLGFFGFNPLNRHYRGSFAISARSKRAETSNGGDKLTTRNIKARRRVLTSINLDKRVQNEKFDDDQFQSPKIIEAKGWNTSYYGQSNEEPDVKDTTKPIYTKICDKKYKEGSGTTELQPNLAIYTRLQAAVDTFSDVLDEFGIRDEVNKFMPYFHWDIWQSVSHEHLRKCNLTNHQFEQYLGVLKALDDIIHSEYNDVLQTVNTIQNDLRTAMPQRNKDGPMSSEGLRTAFELTAKSHRSYIRNELLENIYRIKTHLLNKIPEMLKYVISNSVVGIFLNSVRRFVKKTFNIGKNHVPKEKLTMETIFKYTYGKTFNPKTLKNPAEINRLSIYPKCNTEDWRIRFLGTGSKTPTDTRLTSTMAFYKKTSPFIWLFDCGEGTKCALEQNFLDPLNVNKIFITHLHGDHCLGLFTFPYLRGRSVPLEIYGPVGIRDLIHDVHCGTSRMETIDCIVHELEICKNDTKSESNLRGHTFIPDESGCLKIFEDEDLTVHAAPLDHTMPTVGYVITENSKDYLCDKRKLRKIAICQDSSNSDKMIPIANDATVLIHEATMNIPYKSNSSVLLELAKEYEDADFSPGVVHTLFEFISKCEVRSNCILHTKMHLQLAITKYLSYVLDKLSCVKGLVEKFEDNPKIHPNDLQKHVLKKDSKSKAEYGLEQYKFMKSNWLSNIKDLISRLKLIKELKTLSSYIKKVQKQTPFLLQLSELLPDFSHKNMLLASRSIISSFMDTEKIQTTDDTFISPDFGAVDLLFPAICEYWEDVTKSDLSREGNFAELYSFFTGINQVWNHKIKDHDWGRLFNQIIQSYGHSTNRMAAEFAIKTNARQLILTHFTNKYSGDNKPASVLTMARIEHDARKVIQRDLKSKHTPRNRCIPVTAAWDGYIIAC